MAGASQVCAAMAAWQVFSEKAAEKIIGHHVQNSKEYAVGAHPWVSRTGKTEGDFYSNTFRSGPMIIGDVGYISTPSKEGSKGYWLENPHGNVRAYGHGPPFGKRFVILERARDNNINWLWAKLALLFRGGGFGTGGGWV